MNTKKLLVIPLALTSITCASFIGTASVQAGMNGTGEKGAQIYCFMRDSGNDHEVSWDAAYSVIKRQTHSLFKTSPKHAAVMIIEAVVQDPSKYSDCGSYLGELFGGNSINTIQENQTNENIEMNKSKGDRYSY
tara:strand:+ start:505 stop:906 length:402 start_codon:yes stop_codon:yes gene_type:complete